MPPAAAAEGGGGEGWALSELEHRGATGQSGRGRGRSGWGAVQSMFSWSAQAHPLDASVVFYLVALLSCPLALLSSVFT